MKRLLPIPLLVLSSVLSLACLSGDSVFAVDPQPKVSQPFQGADTPLWQHLLSGLVQPDQGTIEFTACFDRPQSELGNTWDFLFSIKSGKMINKAGRGQSLFAILVPPLPDTGLVAFAKTGTSHARVGDKDFVCTPGKPVNLALSWGKHLTLWCDGKPLGSTPLKDTPAEAFWRAEIECNRYGPFDPKWMRISSIERDATNIDADPATPFVADADTTLVAGPTFKDVQTPESRWQKASGYAMARPLWLPEEQYLDPSVPAVFPLAVANYGSTPRIAQVELTLTPQGGKPVNVRKEVLIAPHTPASMMRVELPQLASNWWQVAWRITGAGLPSLDGVSAIVVYPRDATPADGALASFYGVHLNEDWSPAPFQRMGVRTSRAWAGSTVFLWYRIEPMPGHFHWEYADAYVKACREGGMEVLGLLGYPSRWAAVDPGEEYKKLHPGFSEQPRRWKPADLDAWARYVRATAARYKGKVRYWEIYNEVNFCPPAPPATFSGSTEDYVELQRIAYREIKAADPEAVVLSSGFSPNANRDLPMKALKEHGLAQWCDVFNDHGYSGVKSTAEWVAEWRRQRPGAPVWQTEQMWFQMDSGPRRCWLAAATPLRYLAAGYERFLNMGTPEVFSNTVTLSPTLDQLVVGVLNNELRPCTKFDGLVDGDAAKKLDMHHRFQRSDGSWLTVVGSERGPMAVTLSAAPQRARDLYGQPLPVTKTAGVRLDVPDMAWLISAAPLEVLAVAPIGDAPLMTNPGFEEILGDTTGGLASCAPRNYTLRDRAYDPKGSVRLSEHPRNGKYAVELSASGTGKVYVFQNVQIYDVGTYELTGWFRVEKGSPEPYVFIYDQDSGKIHEAKLTDSGDGFRRLKLEVKLPGRNVQPLAVGWGITGTGTVTLDDVDFVAVQSRVDH